MGIAEDNLQRPITAKAANKIMIRKKNQKPDVDKNPKIRSGMRHPYSLKK